jgi:hypothetical protein
MQYTPTVLKCPIDLIQVFPASVLLSHRMRRQVIRRLFESLIHLEDIKHTFLGIVKRLLCFSKFGQG